MIRRLQTTIERLLLRGVHYRLFLAALLIFLVSFLAGAVILILDPNVTALDSAVWWAFLRLTDPGYLGDDEGVVGRSVSTVVTVLGFLLFIGLLIAILTQWMNEWIRRIESGSAALKMQDHILILGWNHRTPSIVLELLKTGNRVARFLETHKATSLRIVILTEQVDLDLRNSLRAGLEELWDDGRILLRAGNPLQIESLERVSFRSAAAIILPGADFAVVQPGVSDAEIVKSLASIAHYINDDRALPLAVAALYNSNRHGVVQAAYPGPLAVVNADQTVARLIAQSVLQPGIWDIYDELLTGNQGNALFLKTPPADISATFGSLHTGAEDALLIGVISAADQSVNLNPANDFVVHATDQLIFIAKEYGDCRILPLQVQPHQHSLTLTQSSKRKRQVLILGWSRKVPLLLNELLCYPESITGIDVVGITPINERDGAEAHELVRHHKVNFLDPDALATLTPERYDNLILIARERLGEEAVADAATLSAYLALKPLRTAEQPEVFVEVLESENERLFDTKRDDVMHSPMVVSYMLSQVALRPDLGKIFSRLAQPTGTGIALRSLPASAAGMTYADIAATIREQGDMAIGIFQSGAESHQTLLNPPADLIWPSTGNDRLVVLTG